MLGVLLALFCSVHASESNNFTWAPPEYGVVDGIVVAWGVTAFQPAVIRITRAITQAHASRVYVIVHTWPQRTQAYTAMQNANVNMDWVTFIQYNSPQTPDDWQFWTRDFMPFQAFDSINTSHLVNFTFDLPRPFSAIFPMDLAQQWGTSMVELNVTLAGGNLIRTGDGQFFSTQKILISNPGVDPRSIDLAIRQYLGGKGYTIYQGLPDQVDVTNHVDMWMLPVNDHTVIVGQFDPGMPGATEVDSAAADLLSRGYTVYRTPAWNDGQMGLNGNHHSYLNAVITNTIVVIPSFQDPRDAIALSVYQTAFPKRTIVPLDARDLAQFQGSWHCITGHLFARNARQAYLKTLATATAAGKKTTATPRGTKGPNPTGTPNPFPLPRQSSLAPAPPPGSCVGRCGSSPSTTPTTTRAVPTVSSQACDCSLECVLGPVVETLSADGKYYYSSSQLGLGAGSLSNGVFGGGFIAPRCCADFNAACQTDLSVGLTTQAEATTVKITPAATTKPTPRNPALSVSVGTRLGGSCSNRCGQGAIGVCSCDISCLILRDCCTDFNQLCTS